MPRKPCRSTSRGSGAGSAATRSSPPRAATLPPGADEVDASQAERLVADGRRLLDSGRAEGAETALTQALGLWRGDAYADFRYEAFAQAEIARLDELRSTAVADLADARLELGWAEELIPELESLVASGRCGSGRGAS